MKQPWYVELNSKINENYSIAQAYYRQREQQFQKVVLRDSLINIEAFEDQIRKIAISFKPEVYDQVVAALAKGVTSVRTGNPSYDMSIDKLLQQVLPSKRKGLEFKAGIEFEHFLANNIRLDNGDAAAIQDYALQHIGTVVNESFMTTSGKDTRTDIAFGKIGKKITNKDQLELTIGLDLEEIKSKVSQDTIMSEIENLIKNNNINLDVFGFQAKIYPGLSGQKWMGSKPMTSLITTEFNNGKTWSSNYAPLYAQYILSKYIINIINPVNIGVVYGNGFMYTSQMLERVRFYVRVAASKWTGKKAAEKRGGGYEIYPKLVSDEITMYVLNKGSMTQFITRTSKGQKVIQIATVANS